jgi:hypothetical protein
MINLLPYGTKQQIRAARLNVVLLRYVITLSISAGFLILACLTTYFFINNSSLFAKSATSSTSDSTIKSEADTIKTNLSMAKSVLAQQVSYSQIISKLAGAIPSGTIINFLSINDGSFGTTTNLQLESTTQDKESLLKTNFESSPYFSNYKLISSTVSQDPNAKYPYLIDFSITINKVTN